MNKTLEQDLSTLAGWLENGEEIFHEGSDPDPVEGELALGEQAEDHSISLRTSHSKTNPHLLPITRRNRIDEVNRGFRGSRVKDMSLEPNMSGELVATGVEYINSLFSYAMVLTGNRTEAEDLVQETYLKAIRGSSTFTPGSNLRAWLFTILRNTWINELRHHRSGPGFVPIDSDQQTSGFPDTSGDPYSAFVAKAAREQVRHAINQLPVTYREIVLLREYEGLSYEEIGRFLDCPIGTVMSRLRRARLRLQILLCETLQAKSTKGQEK